MQRKGISGSGFIELTVPPEVVEALSTRTAAKIGKQSLYADPADVLNRETEGDFDLLKEMNERLGYNLLWVRCRAIDADVPNANGDYFSEEELLKEVIHNGRKVPAYKTFEGVPIHTNHDNKDIQKAKGEVVYAEWDPREKCVYCTFYVSEDAYPDICNGVRIGMIHDVSMGCTVESGICSVCGKEAVKVEDYCEHLKKYKGKHLPGTRNRVFEKNKGIKFIELSLVNDGAFDGCIIMELYDNDELMQKALEFNRRVASIGDGIERAAKAVYELPPSARRECEGLLRSVVATTQTAARLAQVQSGAMSQYLAMPGANANTTVSGILKALGMDAGQSLNILDLLNVALNFLEVGVMQLFTKKDNVDLSHVSKIAKAMSDLQGTMQDLIDDGVDSPSGAQAQGALLNPSGGQQGQVPNQPVPGFDRNGPPISAQGGYQPTAAGVGQMMGPAGAPKVMQEAFTPGHKPLNPLLGPAMASSRPTLVWADANADGTREVYASRRGAGDAFERFGQSLLALADSVGVDHKAAATSVRAANNEQNVKHGVPARAGAAGGNTRMNNLFKRMANKLRERTANAVSYDAKFDDPEGQHRVVISTDGNVRGYYQNRLANWQPALTDDIIGAIENEQMEYVGPVFLNDLKSHVRTAQSKGIDVWDLDLEPYGESDVKEHELEKERQPIKGDGERINDYLDAKRTNPDGETVREKELEKKRKEPKGDKVIENKLEEDSGLYHRRDNGMEIHDFLTDDARCSCPDEHIEVRLEAVRGRKDDADIRKMAFACINALGSAAVSARVTPEEILETAARIASIDDLENMIALAHVGTDNRERQAARHSFYNNSMPMVGAENAVYHALGKVVGNDMKAGDVADALGAVVSEREAALKSVTRVAKAFIENANVEPAAIRNASSRKEMLRAATSALAAEEDAAGASRGHLRAALFALAGAAEECSATPEEVIEVVVGEESTSVLANIEMARTASASEARRLRRRREEFYGKRFASSADVSETVYGWLADFANDGDMSSAGLAEAVSMLGQKAAAASSLLTKVMERQSAVTVTDEKCTTKRLNARVEDFGDLDPKAPDFDQQFRQRAMEIFRQANYEVDDGTFNLTNLSVDEMGNIMAEVSARLTKTFKVDSQSAPVDAVSGVDAAVSAAPVEDQGGTLYTAAAVKSMGNERVAQLMGGAPMAPPAGGGIDPLAGAVDPAGGGFSAMTVPSESGAPGTAPMEEEGNTDEMPEPGSKKPWGSICPVCGSASVTIANGEGECKSCGTQLKFKLLVEAAPSADNPAPDAGVTGAEEVPAPDMMAPEAAMPGVDGMGGGAQPAAPGAPPMLMQASWESNPLVFQRYAEVAKNVDSEQARQNRLAMQKLPLGHICPNCGNRDSVEKIRNKSHCLGCGTIAVSSVDKATRPNRVTNVITWPIM